MKARIKSPTVINQDVWKNLKEVVRTQGLQTCIFDTGPLSLQYDGLEYRFRIVNNRVRLESIVVLREIILGAVYNHENTLYDYYKNKGYF